MPHAKSGIPLEPGLAVAMVLVLAMVVFLGAQSASTTETPPELAQALTTLSEGDADLALASLDGLVAQGNEKARALAGLLCIHFLSATCDPRRAVEWLEPGAQQEGAAELQYGLALALLRVGPEHAQSSLRWLSRAADLGHAPALTDLGVMKLKEVDSGTALDGFRLVEQAAHAGYGSAQFILGSLYETGKGAPVDLEAAVRFYRAAAELGHSVAQLRLGALLEQGRGVPLDLSAADEWYRRAAQAGISEAKFHLGMMYMRGDAGAPDYFEGISWLEQAANDGHARAQDALAHAYFEGVGVRQDKEEALRLFELAGGQGLLSAQHNAGAIYEKDFYLASPAGAVEWYARAASGGYGPSMLSLGDLYRHGLSVPRSLAVAQGWYSMARNHADPEIARLAEARMNSTLGDSIAVGMGVIGLAQDGRFPTAIAFFDAIIAAGIYEKVLYPNAGAHLEPSLRESLAEVDRANRAMLNRWNEQTLVGLMMDP